MLKRRRTYGAGFGVLFALLTSAAPDARQVTTGTIVGTVTDSNGIVPGATVTIREVNRGTSDTFVTDASGSYTAPFLTPGTYTVEVSVAGFKKWVARRRHPPGQPARARRRHARGRRHRRNHHGRRVGAAAPDRFVRSRHGHRGAGDQGAAAERPQLRGPGLPDARDHARPGGREPVGRQHLQPARRVELQRARPSGQRQRLADRRHRQQRVHVQHRDHRALGRAGARVQGALRRVLGRVRPRRRRRLGRRPSRAATSSTARCSSTCATTRSTRGTSSCARSRCRTAACRSIRSRR